MDSKALTSSQKYYLLPVLFVQCCIVLLKTQICSADIMFVFYSREHLMSPNAFSIISFPINIKQNVRWYNISICHGSSIDTGEPIKATTAIKLLFHWKRYEIFIRSVISWKHATYRVCWVSARTAGTCWSSQFEFHRTEKSARVAYHNGTIIRAFKPFAARLPIVLLHHFPLRQTKKRWLLSPL